MSRYREEAKGQLDSRSAGEGDSPWRGVFPQLPPDKIPPGWAQDALNMTFTDLEAMSRKGTYCPAGMRAIGLTGEACFGSGLWNDRNGVEWLMIATADGVWRLHDGRTPRKIEIPEPITNRVEIVQAGTTLYLFRGSGLARWKWTGDVFTPWAPVDATESEDGTVPMPNGPDRYGLRPVAPGDRLCVPYDRRRLAVSDIGVFERYDRSFHDYNIAGKRGGETVQLLSFANTNLLIFCTDSVLIASGLEGTLANFAIGDVNGDIGCVAGGSVATVGGDAFFLSSTGVYRVRQVVQERLETAAEAISAPIRPYIDRINGAAIEKCVAAVHGRYYWLAVPLDDAAEPDTLLRYDTITGAWQGLEQINYHDRRFAIHALHVTDFQGKPRLYAVDYTRSIVRIFDYSLSRDHTPAGEAGLEGTPAFCTVTAGATLNGIAVDGIYPDSGETFNGQPVYVSEDSLFKIYLAAAEPNGWFLTAFDHELGNPFWFGGNSPTDPSSSPSVYQASGAEAIGNPFVTLTPQDPEPPEHQPISARLVTRRFTQDENEDKRTMRGSVNLRGWGPNYAVSAKLPGVNDSQTAVQATAPDRTKWKVFGKAAYDPSNAGDNHADPDREDYSVDLEEDAADPGENGIDFDLYQSHAEPFNVRRYGRHTQLEITNTAGSLAVVSVQVDADPGRKAVRRS